MSGTSAGHAPAAAPPTIRLLGLQAQTGGPNPVRPRAVERTGGDWLVIMGGHGASQRLLRGGLMARRSRRGEHWVPQEAV
jgi:hypothetical protein